MNECVFCKVINKEIPANIIYEDDKFLTFLDISPINKGHVLVIPKEHYENFLETPAELLAEMAKVVKKVGEAVRQATGAEGINFGVNNGKAAGQIIFHTHWHIIPRFFNDGLKLWGSGQYENDEEAKSVAEKIKEKI